MALLLETTIGDLVIDLDVDGSPALCENILKLAKARYYTGSLVYNVQPNRFCQLGDPSGDGSGGACIYGVLDAYEESRKRNDETIPNVLVSQRRFMKSDMGRALTKDECEQRGRVIATEMNGIADTIGSQLLITIDEGPDRALDGFRTDGIGIKAGANSETSEGLTQQKFRSVGMVVEDDNDVLEKLNATYCDSNGRPYADVRVIRAMVIDDPFDDPKGMDQLLKDRGVILVPGENSNDTTNDRILRHIVSDSPDYERPPEEKVETRISAADVDDENDTEGDIKKMRIQEEERLKREDKSRAVVLEMLGDLPSANITAPENVLFVCKLNPVTEDEDLELIFSRFDEKVSVDIVRDHKTGASLQYAFVEFTTKDQAAEAYFKMNNALVDDRRIKVDFSQSVSKVWDRFNQRNRRQSSSNFSMPKDPLREEQQMSRQRNSHGDRERQNETRSDKRGGYGTSSHHSHYRHREDGHNRRHDFSRRDTERYRDSHRDHHRQNLDFRSRTSRDDGDRYSRPRDLTHRTDRRRDDSSSRRRREREDRGRRSRSRSRSRSRNRSSSESRVERRERRHSSRKKSRKKHDRRRDDDGRHQKRSRHHSKHRPHERDRYEARGKERHRDSPSNSRS